jgi:hypothetical protein
MQYEGNDEREKELAMHACEFKKSIDALEKAKSDYGCNDEGPWINCINDPLLKKTIGCPDDMRLSMCEEIIVGDYNDAVAEFDNFVHYDYNDYDDKIVDAILKKKNKRQ